MDRKRRLRTPASSDHKGAEALFQRGCRLLEGKDLCAAEACFRRVLHLAPGLGEAHINLGVTLERRGAPKEAEACYTRALALGTDDPQASLNLGALLVQQKRFQEAGRIYARALERCPRVPSLWSNLGVLHVCEERAADAEHCFRTALALDGAHSRARFNLSYLLLREGRFEEGWSALEARPGSLDLTARIPGPRWQGESLAGKSLLIGPEGGFGDMIQFCRYAPWLKERGAARIGIVCHPALKSLLATIPGVDIVVALGEQIPEPSWDLWTLPLSLPHHCGTRLDNIPAPIPYLQASPGQVQAWRTRLPEGPRVGLAWKGNPRFENDGDRSLASLDLLAPLAAVEGVRFVSLQKGVGEEEALEPPQGLELFNPTPWIEDLSDAAALVASLDLVISVDTAAAHLAGALGRPCWVLLPSYKSDWRWLRKRADSPWYPDSMRLFRQPTEGGWAPVIQDLAGALQQFVADYPTVRLPPAPQG